MGEGDVPTKKICRVCDRPLTQGRGKSKEHVIPNWMQRYFGLEKAKIAYTPIESLDIPLSMQLTPPAAHHPQRQHNLGSFLVGSVCKDCNDGWMSEIENAAKESLISLIEGNGPIIPSNAIARWAAKTAYTFTIANDPPIGRVPQRHMLFLKSSKSIPPGVRVFARLDSEAEWWFSSATTFVVQIAQPAPDIASTIAQRHFRNSYRYFFRLGRLTLLVQFWPSLVDAVEYHADFLHLVGSNGESGPFTDEFPGFPEPGLNFDLAIRSTRCGLSFDKRPLGDLCACGSGLIAMICTLQQHPDNPAGNWGWV